MAATTLTLSDFLLARIKEDESVARSIDVDPRGVARNWGRPAWRALLIGRPWGRERDMYLAECEAKRRIVELHRPSVIDMDHPYTLCIECEDHYEDNWPCATLRLLAMPYQDHRDFRPEWKPNG